MADYYSTRKDGVEFLKNGRSHERVWRKQGMSCRVYEAHCRAVRDVQFRRVRENPYPPGRRHDTYAATIAASKEG
jgi:hypothetical protein